MLRTIDAPQMRSINRAAVLQLIRQHGPIARSELSRELNLSAPTVMRIVNQLMAEGVVRSTGQTRSTSGRRRELLEYYKDGQAIIGVDLGGTKMFGAVANIGGEILDEISIDGHGTSGQESFEMLSDLIQKLLARPRKNNQRIRGIGVGAPGITRSREGIVEWAPSLNWRDFYLREKLAELFNLPIALDNDVNLAALGENWFGVGRGTRQMVLISIGTGVGAGIIIDGALYRGANEAAGEVGYMLTDRQELGRRYEHFGALESIISGTGVAERARALLSNHLPDELGPITSVEVFEGARRNEPWACKIVSETVDYLSIGIVNIAAVLDPELIILGGGVAAAADMLIPPVLERIRLVVPHVPRIQASTLGYRAAVMGAIAQIVYATTDFYVVRKLY